MDRFHREHWRTDFEDHTFGASYEQPVGGSVSTGLARSRDFQILSASGCQAIALAPPMHASSVKEDPSRQRQTNREVGAQSHGSGKCLTAGLPKKEP